MGITFNNRHSDEFGVCVNTTSMSVIPQKRQMDEEVQGRDGSYIFEDGYNNIKIELECTIPGDKILDRRKKARQVALWLTDTGILVFDYERDIEYNVVKVTNDVAESMLSREYRDTFTIIFECEPYQHQSYYNDNLTWDDATGAWDYTNIPWEGHDRTFTVSAGQTIDVINAGTYKTFPVIKLSGQALSITMGPIIFTNLSGIVYIDCKNKLVYSLDGDSKVNKIGNFDGDFLELLPGSNKFQIGGTITNLVVEFDYRNTYL